METGNMTTRRDFLKSIVAMSILTPDAKRDLAAAKLPIPKYERIDDWLHSAEDVQPQWRARRYLRQTLQSSPTLQAAIDERGDRRMNAWIHDLFEHPYWSFEPRRDSQADNDEQTGFLESQSFTSVCMGGNGCLGGEETIWDPVLQKHRRVDEIRSVLNVLSLNMESGKEEIREASLPWVKGTAPICKWTFSTGDTLIATDQHRMLTQGGTWETLLTAGINEIPLRHILDGRESQPALVTKREYLRTGMYYDLECRPHENYLTKGFWSHNSGKSYLGSQRAIKFLCEDQEPPLRDTPFFVIADNLLECARTCWSQHLYNIFPYSWVDWERVVYARRTMNWPSAVPLKSWPGKPNKNWVIYFCGYSQERKAFQSVAAGGAWFTEQFPFEIYEEIVARMRRWMYPGSIWMEFTPVDPNLSRNLQKKYDEASQGKIDNRDWSFYRLNTESAEKAGHTKKGYVSTLKATTSKEMLPTRLYGAFAGWQGAIYQVFNPKVHLVPNDYYGPIHYNVDAMHKRCIDWGSGPDNAFVVLWFQRDSMGRYWFYDEYYTTDQTMTWEDHCRAVHRKDGWDLVADTVGGKLSYRLEPLCSFPRWKYDRSNFSQTYAPPDDPGIAREFTKYLLPVTKVRTTGYYEAGIDCIQRHLKYDQHTLSQRTEPKLLIDREKCPNLAWELPALRWQEMIEHSVNPRAPKRYQKKVLDHSCDAARIGCFADWQESSGGSTASGHRVEPPPRPQVRHKRERR